MQENSINTEDQSAEKRSRTKRYAGDLGTNTYMSKREKVDSEFNRRTLEKKALKAFIQGKDFFKYKGEEFPVLYYYDKSE
jgi:hypothetical protein